MKQKKLGKILLLFLVLIALSNNVFSFNFGNTSPLVDSDPKSLNKNILEESYEDTLLTSLIVTNFNFTNNPDDSLYFGFVKPVISQSPDSAYFNVLKIKNYGVNRFRGLLRLYIPDNWNSFSLLPEEITLDPGDSLALPVRVTLPNQLRGGVAYVVMASITTRKEEFTTNGYVKAPRKTDWNMSLSNNLAYFNEYEEDVKVSVKLTNNGNVQEVIKLSSDIGSMLILDKSMLPVEYVILEPFSDTTLVFPFKYLRLKDTEEEAYHRFNWQSNLVNFVADNGVTRKSDTFRVRKLESFYHNGSNYNNSPLNFDFQVFNLLSEFTPRVNTSLYGNILFDNSQLGYFFNAFNVGFEPFSANSFDQNIRFGANYNDKYVSLRIGDNLGNNVLHNIFGRGVSATIRPTGSGKLFFGATYTENIFQPITGTNFELGGQIKKVRLHGAVTREVNTFQNYISNSASLKATLPILKFQTLSFGVNVSDNQFSNLQDRFSAFNPTINDTATIGYGYYASYGLNLKRFTLSFYRVDNLNNYHRSAGFSSSYGMARYSLNSKTSLTLNYTENQFLQLRYPIRFFFPESNSGFRMFQLGFNRNINEKVYYRVGPMVSRSERSIYNFSNLTTQELDNVNYGFMGQLNYRLTPDLLLSPNLFFGMADVTSRILPEELGFETINNPRVFNTSTGLNVTSRYLRLNVLYTLGPVNFSGFQTGEVSTRAQTLMIRPYYERFLIPKLLKFSLIANYITQTPTNIENFTALARADFFLNDGWRVYVGQNLFTTRRLGGEQAGMPTNRNYNMIIGVNKAFDIQQPRLSYYDFDVICFHDLNGNGIKDDNEPPIANVMMDIERMNNQGDNRYVNYVQTQLISNPEGLMGYSRIPEGIYKLNFTPLVNLGNLYNVYGEVQEVVIANNTTIYVPFAESYSVKGEVKVVMSKFSNRTRPPLAGIRVTAQGANGETYSVLTNSQGEYILNIPQGSSYVIKVNNVFDEDFEIARDNYKVDFNGIKTFVLDFVFKERERRINFGFEGNDEDEISDEEYFKQLREKAGIEQSDADEAVTPAAPQPTTQPATQPQQQTQPQAQPQSLNDTNQDNQSVMGEPSDAENAQQDSQSSDTPQGSDELGASDGSTENISEQQATSQQAEEQAQQADEQGAINEEVDPFAELEQVLDQLIEQRTGQPAADGANQIDGGAGTDDPIDALSGAVNELIGDEQAPDLSPASDYSGEFGEMERLADQLLQQGSVIGQDGIQQGDANQQTVTQEFEQSATESSTQNLQQEGTQEAAQLAEQSAQQSAAQAAEQASGGAQAAQAAANQGAASQATPNPENIEQAIPEGEELANIRIAREAKDADDRQDRGTVNPNTIPREGTIADLPQDYDPEKIKFNVQTGSFTQEIPLRVHEKFLAIGFKARKTADGRTRYLAGDFDTLEQARAFKDRLQALGFQDAFAIGSYENIHLSAGEALQLKFR
jgi:hypothetical protein